MKKHWLLLATLGIWLAVFMVKFQNKQLKLDRSEDQDLQILSKIPSWTDLTSMTIKRQGLDRPIQLIKSQDHLWLQYTDLGFQKKVDPYVEKAIKTAFSQEFEVIQVLEVPSNQLKKFALTEVALRVSLVTQQGQIHFRVGQEIQKSDTFVLFVDDKGQPFKSDKNTYKVIRFNQRLRFLFDRDPKHWQALMPLSQLDSTQKTTTQKTDEITTIRYFENKGDLKWDLKWDLKYESKLQQWHLNNQAQLDAYQSLSPLKISKPITQSLIYTLTHLKYEFYLEDQLSTKEYQNFKFQPIGYFEYTNIQGKGYRLEIQPVINSNQSHHGLYLKLSALEDQKDQPSIAYLPYSQSSFLITPLENLLDRTLGLDQSQSVQSIEWQVEGKHWRLQRIFSKDPLIQWQWEDLINHQKKFVSVNGFDDFWQLLKSEGNGFKYLPDPIKIQQEAKAKDTMQIQRACPPPLACDDLKVFEVIKHTEHQLFLMKTSPLPQDPYLSLSQVLFEMIERYFETYQLK